MNLAKLAGTLLTMAAVALLAPPPAVGQSQAEYGAFEIVVTTPRGKPVVGSVAVLTRDGRAVGKAFTNEHGIARICDAPSGTLLSVEVGGKLCGAVAVRYLTPTGGQRGGST